jgi:hypothetical protein
MKLRVSTDGFRLAVLAAIGSLGAAACGGSTRTDGDPIGTGGASGGMPASSGGHAAGGSGPSNGGTAADEERFTTCKNPTPLGGGYERCESGVVHRASSGICNSFIDPNAVVNPMLGMGECTKNSDCTARPHGYCNTPGYPGAISACAYGCVNDSECAKGSICLCNSLIGTCVEATCAKDSDCEDHLLCMKGTTTIGVGCGSTDSFACGPMCRTDADCPSSISGPGTCVMGNCSVLGPACGRPFLVGGAARLSPLAARADYGDALTPGVESLSVAARAALAAHYTDVALMEHASVAAFARFVLELLSLGAPAELVALAGDAMRDEMRHARVCFGLASAYGGAPAGPGPLETSGALAAASFEERLKTAFLEACVGETIAALEVAEAAERATDPVVVGVLRGIAEDEMRHATLGFRFVKWGLGVLPPARRAALEAELLAAIEERLSSAARVVASTCDDRTLTAHGLLAESAVRAVRVKALEEVAFPCARAMFEAPPSC